jgi:hypothetical protein
MDEDSDRLKILFAQLLEKETTTDRQAFLAKVGLDNPELRQELESLLRAHEEAGEFLDKTISMDVER